MATEAPSELDEWLNLVDLGAIADPYDKIGECEYFLEFASREQDPGRFRWLISAFFSAAYSFFEISALNAFHAITDPATGKQLEDSEATAILRRYVTVFQNAKNPSFVKT